VKIKDFHITGQYPALSVETEVEDHDGGEASGPVKLNLGPWNYVSLLSESELKSLVHLVYQSQRHQPTQAMRNVTGANLENATDAELP
jgi:hypothetical protein